MYISQFNEIGCSCCGHFEYFTTKSSNLIHGEKVKVNWAVRDQPAFELHESDMLSIRGYGRFKVIAIEGRTRKDKIRLQLEN